MFRKPFVWQGVEYEKLSFDWDKLTGNDSLAVEREMQSLGIPLVVPAFSGDYLIRMAARACTTRIGADAFGAMSLPDHHKIRNAARSFLLQSEQSPVTEEAGSDGNAS
jgi:hypothetical protein